MSESDNGSTADSEEVWRRRLAEAERKYRDAIRAFVEALAGGSGEAIAAAARTRDQAREEFHRVLRIFSDMVIRGKPPRKGN